MGGEMRRVIYKRFRATSRTDPWLALVRATPALRSWRYGHSLLDRGLPTARPLAVFHRRRHGLFGDGYLLTEKIPEAVELHQFLNGVAEIGVERVKILRLRIEQVARLVRDLHQRNLSQRDLKASNILVGPYLTSEPVRFLPALTQPGSPVWDGEPSSPVGKSVPGSLAFDGDGVWLIDLVGIRCYRRLSRRRKVQNLARLHASILRHFVVTRTDKLRFLRCYMQWGLKGKGGWKKWWRQVEEATQAKVERNLRNGRPLG
jgi:lipopolysaccharide kinase (Kdo/WaaP) family protein